MPKLLLPFLGLALSLMLVPGVSAQTVHEVKMVDISPTEFRFEPAEVTVKPGDVVRWIYAGTLGQPHNVEFRSPSTIGQAVSSEPGIVGTMSPFLTKDGETWEVAIDDRFQVGVVHPYVCTPHEAFGMKGTIKVEAGEKAPAR
ncbi:MAG: plastocyanin/azurin family copper-binding protein [Gemmatimonadota bacterium]